MQRAAWLLAILGMTAAATWAAVRQGAITEVADLTTTFVDARKQPSEAAFFVRDVSVGGRTQSSIVTASATRLTYHVTVPKDASFRASIALGPDVPDAAGGVLFFVGVFDGHAYRTLRTVTLRPERDRSGRRWRDLAIGLDEYAGLTVDLILNTRGEPGAALPAGPVAVWGAPAVITR